MKGHFKNVKDQTCCNADWEACVKVLELLDRGVEIPQDREPIEILVSRLQRKIRKRIRKSSFQQKRAHDKAAIKQTARVLNTDEDSMVGVGTEPQAGTSIDGLREIPANCHICQSSFREIHFHYHKLCPRCADFNYSKRENKLDLSGRRAIVTGARIKIGYQTALRLLRGGAHVIATTRFPRDSAVRYAQEPDFEQWQDRLTIHHLDFRDIPFLMTWVEQISKDEPIDILINNAAQTVWRPEAHYQQQLALESASVESIPRRLQQLIAQETTPVIEKTHEAGLLQQHIENNDLTTKYFKTPFRSKRASKSNASGERRTSFEMLSSEFREPIDKRDINSWELRLHEVKPLEFLEVQLINVTAPFILTSMLKPIMMRSKFEKRFVVNVSGKDGRFGVDDKTIRHPHVNMSKAAVNMMTRSSAQDYAANGIFMNSVDTGWITLEGGFSRVQQIKESGFVPPLDAIDGAARICDPIDVGISGEPEFGNLLKDYQPADW